MGTQDTSEARKLSRLIGSRLRQERERHAWTQSEVAERIGTTQINVSRWENGVTMPGLYYRQKLGELFGKSVQQLGFTPESGENTSNEEHSFTDTSNTSTTSSLPIWYVPYRRNPFFTGREEILLHLYTMLRGNRVAALTQPQAISGLGGIGKTQVAVEYAYRYRDSYQAIFWLTASSRDALSAEFVKIATLLNLPELQEQDQELVVRAAMRWLSSHNHWLLVLDNVEYPKLIVDFLPMHGMGDVLLTTRLQALGTIAQSIEVEKMGQEEGIIFLLRRAKVITSEVSLDQATKESRDQATEIVAVLDRLPLALDQAGAYIEETRCGLPQYLKLYSTSRKELLLRRGRSLIDHPDSVVATWSLSFQQIEQENPAAAELLRLLAFLDPETIPEEIISLGATELGPVLGAAASDPFKLDTIIELLLRYSLVRRTPEIKCLSMHRLVQAVLKDMMDEDLQHTWAERAIRATNCAFPDVEVQTWEQCQRCLPHVQMCAIYIAEYRMAFPEAARLLNETASYLVARGGYQQAEPLLLTALELRQQILEAEHPDTACTLNDLGVLYVKQGKYRKAEPLLQEALVLRQGVLGENHPDVAQTLHNLASVYRSLGNYVKAEPFYTRALHIRETTLGFNHFLVAQSYYGLTKLHNSLTQYQQAEVFCRKALSIQKQLYGDNHPLIASTLNMLAKTYQGQNKLELAKEENMQALQIRENISGVDHPHVATILNSLVEIYHAQGRYQEAEPLIVRALRIHTQSLGPEHPFMAYSLGNQAENFFLREDFVQAESFYMQALSIREQNLGTHHPHTALAYYNLARCYANLERHKEAESFYKRALSAQEFTFGQDHPTLLKTLEQLGTLLKKLQRDSEADELERRMQGIKARQIAHISP